MGDVYALFTILTINLVVMCIAFTPHALKVASDYIEYLTHLIKGEVDG